MKTQKMTLEGLARLVAEGCDGVEKRFDGFEKRFIALEEKVDTGFREMREEFKEVHLLIERVDSREEVANLEVRVRRLEKKTGIAD